jgi:hypothetical protein
VSSYAETVAALTSLTRSQLEVFGTGAASRLAPVVDRFASAGARRRYADGLAALWAAPGRLDGQRATELLTALDRLPEADPEDDLGPEEDVMQALRTLAAALRVARGDEVAEPAGAMCSLPWTYAGEADSILGQVPAKRWWDRGAERTGPLESAEVQAQQESLRILAEHGDAVDRAAGAIRRLSEEYAAVLAPALPEYARRRGWAG